MPAERSSSKGDIFLGPTAYPGTPKGLLDAISEIQQYYVVERSGSTISDDFLTFKGKLSFFEVGFKVSAVSTLISILLTPVAIGVVQRYIPIFGSYQPSLFDKVFAMVLALSFSSGYGLIMTVLGKYYIGSISKAAIRNLLGGLIVGSVFKVAVAFILFHFIYFVVLEPVRLSGLLLKLRPALKPEIVNSIYLWLIDFKPVFLTSAYFIAFSAFIMVAIPLGTILIVSRRAKRIIEHEQTWS
jgi:hypothetical protein